MNDFKTQLITDLTARAKQLGRPLTKLEMVETFVAVHEAALPALQQPVKAQKKPKLAGEGDWVASLENEPSLAGIDIKKQLGMAQFWCKNNGRLCTRKFFTGWLQRADRTITMNADGKSSKVTVVADIYVTPPNWEQAAIKLYGYDVAQRMKENGWLDLGPDIRTNILRAIR